MALTNKIKTRDSKDNELWEFKGYFSKIADLPPNILSEVRKNWIEKQKCVQSHKIENW